MPAWYLPSVKRTALFLKDEHKQKLAQISKKTGVPMSEQIRRAIDAYLKQVQTKTAASAN